MRFTRPIEQSTSLGWMKTDETETGMITLNDYNSFWNRERERLICALQSEAVVSLSQKLRLRVRPEMTY